MTENTSKGYMTARRIFDNNESSSSSRSFKLNNSEDSEGDCDLTSLISTFEEPVLVTDPLELFSVKHRMDTYDKDCEEIKQLRDTHSFSELDAQLSVSPQRQLEKNETVVSSTSLDVITPIKKMIRINNTPEKKNSSLNIGGNSLEGHHNQKNRLKFTSRRIPMSNNIMNFKAVLNPEEQDSEETIEDIKEYLNYVK